MDTSPTEKVSFPVFSDISTLDDDLGQLGDIPTWLEKANDGYSGENIIKKLQQTKYDRVIKTVIADGMHNLLLNQYTTMILPNFRDEDIMELTLIAARLKTMGLNASAAAVSGECGEVLNTQKVAKYYTNYVPGTRLIMPNMERKLCDDFSREKVQYEKPAYNPDHDPFIVQRKIQQLRLHGMARLRKGLLEIQREQKELNKARKKSSGSDSSCSSPSSTPRKLQRPNNLRFPSSNSLRTDSKLDDFNIKRPLSDTSEGDSAKIFKRTSVNDEILATRLEDSMSTDSDSEGRVSINSSVFSSPVIAPPNLIVKEEPVKKDEDKPIENSTDDSESSSESTSSGEKEGEVELEEESERNELKSDGSVEEAQFDVMNVESDSDGSISF